MNRIAVAKELVKLAKALASKTHPKILDNESENKKLWMAIEDMVPDITEEIEESGENNKAEEMVDAKSKELARKFARHFSGTNVELEKMIWEYIWEEHQNAI
jgi:hypothetical protein